MKTRRTETWTIRHNSHTRRQFAWLRTFATREEQISAADGQLGWTEFVKGCSGYRYGFEDGYAERLRDFCLDNLNNV